MSHCWQEPSVDMSNLVLLTNMYTYVPFLNQRNLDDLKIMTNFQLANCARVIVAAAVAASNVCTKKALVLF